MKGFERYDLNRWTESGLSFHPAVVELQPSQPRRSHTYFAKLALAATSVAAFGIGLAQISVGYLANRESGNVVLARAQPFAVSLISSGPPGIGPLDQFEKLAQNLISEIHSGVLTDVSAETLALAERTVARHADASASVKPDWVEKVANAVATLND